MSESKNYRDWLAKYPLDLPIMFPLKEAKEAFDHAREVLGFTRKKLMPEVE